MDSTYTARRSSSSYSPTLRDAASPSPPPPPPPSRSASSCLNLSNVTLVVPSQEELNYQVFMYTMFNSPAPALRDLTEFYRADLNTKVIQVGVFLSSCLPVDALVSVFVSVVFGPESVLCGCVCLSIRPAPCVLLYSSLMYLPA